MKLDYTSFDMARLNIQAILIFKEQLDALKEDIEKRKLIDNMEYNTTKSILNIFQNFAFYISDEQKEIFSQYVSENIDSLEERPNAEFDVNQFTANIFRYLGYQITEPMKDGDEPIPCYADRDHFHILNYKAS